MNFFKSHFNYSKRERNGIFFLVIIIIGLQLIYFFVDFSSDEKVDINQSTIIAFQKEFDSLNQIVSKKNTTQKFQFNPNYLTDFRAYQLGMSVDEIDKLIAYRSTGKYINSVKEFQNVTGVNDSLLNIIAPLFKFPKWVNKNKPSIKLPESVNIVIQDINSVSGNDFIKIGVHPKIATRIIKYREKLNGFSYNYQLYEVWGLSKNIADKILQHYKVLEQPKIEKLNINEASFKEVLRIVYLDYELTKKIFNYKDEVAEIQNIEELKKIEGFPLDKFDRIALYLDAK